MRTRTFVSEEAKEMLIRHISMEQHAGNLYLNIASYFDSKSLKNTYKFFYQQYKEKIDAAEKIYRYLLTAGVRVKPIGVAATELDQESTLPIVDQYAQTERNLTDDLRKICDKLLDDSDHTSYNYILKVVGHQLIEEDEGETIKKNYHIAPSEILADHQVPDLFPHIFKEDDDDDDDDKQGDNYGL